MRREDHFCGGQVRFMPQTRKAAWCSDVVDNLSSSWVLPLSLFAFSIGNKSPLLAPFCPTHRSPWTHWIWPGREIWRNWSDLKFLAGSWVLARHLTGSGSGQSRSIHTWNEARPLLCARCRLLAWLGGECCRPSFTGRHNSYRRYRCRRRQDCFVSVSRSAPPLFPEWSDAH